MVNRNLLWLHRKANQNILLSQADSTTILMNRQKNKDFKQH